MIVMKKRLRVFLSLSDDQAISRPPYNPISASSLFFTTCCFTALTGFNELASSTEKKNIAPAMHTTHAMITATFVIPRSFHRAQIMYGSLFCFVPRPACTLQACVPLLNLPEPTFGNIQGNETRKRIKKLSLGVLELKISKAMPKIFPPLRPTRRQSVFTVPDRHCSSRYNSLCAFLNRPARNSELTKSYINSSLLIRQGVYTIYLS